MVNNEHEHENIIHIRHCYFDRYPIIVYYITVSIKYMRIRAYTRSVISYSTNRTMQRASIGLRPLWLSDKSTHAYIYDDSANTCLWSV